MGLDRMGKAGMEWSVVEGNGQEWSGEERQERTGLERTGNEWRGWSVREGRGRDRTGMERLE
jgi:hypothetical protein